MKNRKLILAAVIVGLAISPAYAYWIWTPKTGKWINPKTVPKASPQEQLEYAKVFYETKKYEDAKREFKKLIKVYPKAAEAAESQYYLGLIEEAQGDLYEAFKAYQKVIDKYPFSERIQQIIEQEYKIGEAFTSGEKRKALGIVLPVENPAIEIFTKVVDNSTYGPLAPKAQYKLGLVLKEVGRSYEAEEAFNKVIANYPESEWVEPAKFQLASCRASESQGSDYDYGATREAKEKFEAFVREYPDAVLSKKAQENIRALSEKEAKSSYDIAFFYEKQKNWESAKIYYNDVITRYKGTSWAAKSMERLNILERKEKKR
ncbi:MAG TPA: tetratricopeptide repeat protein [Patescibacteria group bacterium]|nr:tetratricopeptide repeat protein [Patescibacteria group bacterium]